MIQRPNRTAQGFTKNEERNKTLGKSRITNPSHPQYHKERTDIYLKLCVHGTTDSLVSANRFSFKRVMKEHPIDKGYFKEVYVLSDMGKKRLQRLRREKQSK